jgi:hypothetical protein
MSAITVGLILFDLVTDSSPMGICGKILEWCKAYDALTESFVRPLFAWIHLGWISVSSVEMHLLVAQGILGAGIALSYSTWENLGFYLLLAPIFIVILIVMLVSLPLAPALLLPGFLGAVGAVLVGLAMLKNVYNVEGASSEYYLARTQSIAFCAVLAFWLILLKNIFYSH